jgi:hypothetical protein
MLDLDLKDGRDQPPTVLSTFAYHPYPVHHSPVIFPRTPEQTSHRRPYDAPQLVPVSSPLRCAPSPPSSGRAASTEPVQHRAVAITQHGGKEGLGARQAGGDAGVRVW